MRVPMKESLDLNIAVSKEGTRSASGGGRS